MKPKEPFIPASLRPPVKVAHCKSLQEIQEQNKEIIQEEEKINDAQERRS